MDKLIRSSEAAVFGHRKFVVSIFAIITFVLLFMASQLKLDAGFEKNIPLEHEYMLNYMKHRADFDGANSILVSVCDTSGNIFNTILGNITTLAVYTFPVFLINIFFMIKCEMLISS